MDGHFWCQPKVLPDDHAALGQELLTIITGEWENILGKIVWNLLENIAGERGDLASDEHTSYAARFISSSKDGLGHRSWDILLRLHIESP